MSLFSKIITDKWYENLIENAHIVIQKVYNEYAPVYKYIIEFIKKNDIHLSNLHLILSKEIEYDEPLHIYVTNPLIISESLFKEICTKFGNDYVMQIEIIERQYTISYITKTYIRISYVDTYEDKSILNFLAPVSINSIKIVPPILELIDLYKQIYNPDNAESWAELIQMSDKIKKIADINIKKTETKLTTGGDNKCNECTDKEIKQITNLIIEFLKKYKDYVLVDLPKPDIRMSIISRNEIQTDFERINNYLIATLGADFTIIFKPKPIFLSKDMRIQKHSIYIYKSHIGEFSNTSSAFLDIYNNLSYELIPYRIENGINIAHDWAQIRFYYIYIWNAFAAYHLNTIKYEKLMSFLTKIKPYIDRSIDWYEPPTEFMGVYVNEYYSFKQLMIKSGKNARIFCSQNSA